MYIYMSIMFINYTNTDLENGRNINIKNWNWRRPKSTRI